MQKRYLNLVINPVCYPQPDWMNFFIKWDNVFLKQATKLSIPKHNAMKSSFIIYHYYDNLEETIKRLNIRNRPHLKWNCNESRLPHDQKKMYGKRRKGTKNNTFRCLRAYMPFLFEELK